MSTPAFEKGGWVTLVEVLKPVLQTEPLSTPFTMGFIEGSQFLHALGSLTSLILRFSSFVSLWTCLDTALGLNMHGNNSVPVLVTRVFDHVQADWAFDDLDRVCLLSFTFVVFSPLVLFAELVSTVLAGKRQVADLVAVFVLASFFEGVELHCFSFVICRFNFDYSR